MKKFTLFTIFIFSLLSTNLYAHPHIFIDADLSFEIKNDSLHSINIRWKWDKWFSLEILDYCDSNKNNNLEPEEVNKVFEDFFIGIKDFDYFTQIEFNNKKSIIHEVLNFNAYTLQKSSNEIYVTYEFSIPINLKISDDILNFKIKKYDETIFTAFENATLKITSNDYELSDIKNITYKFCGKQLSGRLKKK